jgi:MFS family permease
MPKARAAMFMGYYFVSMALGFLFGGILSGWAYDRFCNQWHLPHLMWLLFAALAAATAFALVVFDRFVAHRFEASREA